MAAIVGNGLAILASWAFTRIVFDLDYRVEWVIVIATALGVAAATTIIGLLNSRAVTAATPLEALRSAE